MRTHAILDDFLHDVRYALRALRRDASLTTFAILIVGLGIGASVTVFSISDALLVRPLPFRDASRLVWIGNGEDYNTQVNHFRDVVERNHSFSELGAYFGGFGVGDNTLTGTGEPERLSGVRVTQNFFHTLGVQPVLGRDFTAEESSGAGPPVALIRHRLWVRRFASDPGIVGRALTINDTPVTVVGVLPASFDFGSVFAPGHQIDLFLPFPLTDATNQWGNTLVIVGRLKPGVTLSAASAEMQAFGQQLTAEHPDRNPFTPKVATLQQHVSGSLRPAMLLLGGGVAVVMLIVCANLSNMLLARATTRQQDIAIRAALGARRSRQIQGMLTESLLLASAGAVLGVGVAALGTRAVAGTNALTLPLLHTVQLDGVSLAFSLALAAAAGVLFGLAPALQIPATGIGHALRTSCRGVTGDKARAWMRNGLVVSEIALACVLLVGAGLLGRSFLKVLDADLGFRPENVAALRVDQGGPRRTLEERNAYFDQVLSRVRQIPGVADAGVTDAVPLVTDRGYGVHAKGGEDRPGHNPDAYIRTITDGYVHTMGVRLLEGRDISVDDTPLTEPVILVNQTAARTLWPGENAIGKILLVTGERRVVGIVGDVRHGALETVSGLEVYVPMRQTNDYASATLVVRSTLAPAALGASVRRVLQPIAPDLAINELRTLQQVVDAAASPRRFFTLMLGGFAVFAIILALLGIYSVISYTVTQRTREIAVRMALGASATRLRGAIMRETLELAAIGLLIGSAASWGVARALGSMLYGVRSTDPLTYAGMLAVLIFAAALGGYLPARRASRTDPMLAMRAS